MKMAIAMLLANFQVESVGTRSGGEVEEHLALTMAPVGLVLKLRAG